MRDVDINGGIAYLALGSHGIVTVDVTDPLNPIVTEGMEAFGEFSVTSVLAGDFSAIGGGTGLATIQVIQDVVLKIHEVDPENRIIDRDALGFEVVTARFNKAIDLWTPNLNHFAMFDSGGNALPIEVEIRNNDAILTLPAQHDLQVGEIVQLRVRAGIESVKPIDENTNIRLYRLQQDQAFDFR